MVEQQQDEAAEDGRDLILEAMMRLALVGALSSASDLYQCVRDVEVLLRRYNPANAATAPVAVDGMVALRSENGRLWERLEGLQLGLQAARRDRDDVCIRERALLERVIALTNAAAAPAAVGGDAGELAPPDTCALCGHDAYAGDGHAPECPTHGTPDAGAGR